MLWDVPDSLESNLARGLAAQLDVWGLATFAESGKYDTDAALPIYWGPDGPANMPDRRLLITVRPSIPVRGRIVQSPVGLNWRGAEDETELHGLDWNAILRKRLDRLSHFDFGAVRVGAVLFSSAGSIGRDSRRRPGATATYMFRGLLDRVNG